MLPLFNKQLQKPVRGSNHHPKLMEIIICKRVKQLYSKNIFSTSLVIKLKQDNGCSQPNARPGRIKQKINKFASQLRPKKLIQPIMYFKHKLALTNILSV